MSVPSTIFDSRPRRQHYPVTRVARNILQRLPPPSYYHVIQKLTLQLPSQSSWNLQQIGKRPTFLMDLVLLKSGETQLATNQHV